MKARLRLARALLPQPRVLLLDEPTGAIDPIAAHSLLGLIMDLARDLGLAVLLSSHRLEEIEALQSYALLLDQGGMRFSGDLDELRNAWEEPILEIVFSGPLVAQRVAARLTASGTNCSVEDAVVRCRVTGRSSIGELFAGMATSERHEVRGMREVPAPLRDLIAHVYSKDSLGERRVS